MVQNPRVLITKLNIIEKKTKSPFSRNPFDRLVLMTKMMSQTDEVSMRHENENTGEESEIPLKKHHRMGRNYGRSKSLQSFVMTASTTSSTFLTHSNPQFESA